MREVSYYINTSDAVRCLLCPNHCKLSNGDTGSCHTRVNIDNKLYTTAYGNPCTINIDPIEKKPLFHFLPSERAYSFATAGCNLNCLNCQNWEISQAAPDSISSYNMIPERIVEDAIINKTKIIAYTYSEPIAFYEYAYDTARIARTKGLKNVLITNGYINEKPLRDIAKYIDAANVNLKSFSDDIYIKLNGGKLKPILNTLKTLKEENVWLEITNLIVPKWTDNMDMIKKMCDWLNDNGLSNQPLHFSKFHPTYKLENIPQTPVSILVQAMEIAIKAGIKYVYIGNVTGHESENTSCHKCKNTLIERKGYLILSNKIYNGCCPFCGEKIPGVWI